MRRPVNLLKFARILVLDAAGGGTSVETMLSANSSTQMPMVVVQTSANTSVRNGPTMAAVTGTIDMICYADDPDQASDFSHDLFSRIHRMWYDGYSNRYGALSHIGRGSDMPQLVASDMEAGDTYRFDITLQVVVTSPPPNA